MKLLIILAVTLGHSALFAKENKSKFDIRVPVKNFFNEYKKGLRLGVAQGSMDLNFRSRTNVNGQTQEDSDREVERTNYQLHFGYEEIKYREPGFSTFFVYQDIAADENVRNMRVSGNVTYGLTEQLYTFGGLNYGKYFGSAAIEDIYSAGIGYQAGFGLKIHKRVNVEFEYLTLLNDGSDQGVNLDLATRGLLIKLNTPLFI